MFRSKSHILEEESWKVFNSAVPDSWVIRKPDPDYGIDAEIEIFSDDGEATGLLFFVQLKATAITDTKRALKLSFKKDMVKYYSSLPLPVMIIRYHSVSKDMYFIWSHSLDLYYTKASKKTFTINFEKGTLWEAKTPNQIYQYLEKLRQENEEYKLPIELLLEYKTDFEDLSLILDLESILFSKIKIQNIPIKVVSKDESDFPTVLTIDKSEIKISSLNKKGNTFHDIQDESGQYDKNTLPYDILTIIGIHTIFMGQDSVGFSIITNNLLDSSLKDSELILDLIGSFILRKKRFDVGLNLLKAILRKETIHEKVDLFNDINFSLVTPYILKYRVDEELESQLIVIINKFYEYCKTIGKEKYAGSFLYSLGNQLRGSKKYEEKIVFSYYKNAARVDPTYLQRDYFWAEGAGILFHQGKYFTAAQFYKRAQKLKKKERIIPLYADSLLFAGYYKKAFRAFSEYIEISKDPHPEWILKHNILKSFYLNKDFFKKQKRNRGAANEKAKINLEKILSSNKKCKDNIVKMEDCFKDDLLCDRAWHNLAHLYLKLKKEDDAFFSFCVLCVLAPYNPENWINCIFTAIKSAPKMLGSLVFFAYEKVGEDLIKALSDNIQNSGRQLDKEAIKQLKFLFETIRKHHAENKDEEIKVVRILSDDAEYIEVPVFKEK